MAKPTRTTNRLHFEDLDHRRFEDLCLALIYPLHRWIDLRHYGRSGVEEGIDIHAVEETEDDGKRVWLIQCKRTKRLTSKDIKIIIEKALAGAEIKPNVFLVIVACDISRRTHEEFERVAKSRGIETALIWTASVLEARLYSERRDLLFSYFGISRVRDEREKEHAVTRNIRIKKRLRKELYDAGVRYVANLKGIDPRSSPGSSSLIIRSIDDTHYPRVGEPSGGISGWFKVDLYDFYHNGIRVVLCNESIIKDKNGRWRLRKFMEQVDESKWLTQNAYRLGCIPFRNIIEVDAGGDECYSEPHIFCRFADGGAPYEGEDFVTIDDKFDWPLLLEHYDGDL